MSELFKAGEPRTLTVVVTINQGDTEANWLWDRLADRKKQNGVSVLGMHEGDLLIDVIDPDDDQAADEKE